MVWLNSFDLEDQFPGNAADPLSIAGTAAQLASNLLIRGNDGNDAAEAGLISSFLFGKSISDFQDNTGTDLTGYTTVNVSGTDVSYCRTSGLMAQK